MCHVPKSVPGAVNTAVHTLALVELIFQCGEMDGKVINTVINDRVGLACRKGRYMKGN